jgi:hypothetical protein
MEGMGLGVMHTPALPCVTDEAVNVKCCSPGPEAMLDIEGREGMLVIETRDESGPGGDAEGEEGAHAHTCQ